MPMYVAIPQETLPARIHHRPHQKYKLTIPRKLDGSCQCGGIEFTLQSSTPVPYQLCACSICRKVGGYSGSVNLGGIADSLKILKGKELIKYGPSIRPP